MGSPAFKRCTPSTQKKATIACLKDIFFPNRSDATLKNNEGDVLNQKNIRPGNRSLPSLAFQESGKGWNAVSKKKNPSLKWKTKGKRKLKSSSPHVSREKE